MHNFHVFHRVSVVGYDSWQICHGVRPHALRLGDRFFAGVAAQFRFSSQSSGGPSVSVSPQDSPRLQRARGLSRSRGQFTEKHTHTTHTSHISGAGDWPFTVSLSSTRANLHGLGIRCANVWVPEDSQYDELPRKQGRQLARFRGMWRQLCVECPPPVLTPQHAETAVSMLPP